MRIRLEFQLKNNVISAEYRKCILSFFKFCLSQLNNGEKFKEYYNDTNTKDFSWCAILSGPKFEKNSVSLSENRMSVIISCDDKKQTGFYLMHSFMNQKGRNYPFGKDNSITLISVKQIRQALILEEECIFKSMPGAPIVVREHIRETNRDKYYCVEDPDFVDKFTQTICYQLKEEGFSEENCKKVKVQIIEGKKVVVKHYGVYINCTICTFKISAPAIILQHLYQNGIGSRRSMGLSMVDVVN